TFTLMRSSTLTVSTFGVRSYSDHRYWSMQASRHASRASELTEGPAGSCTGSVGLTAANNAGAAVGDGLGGGSDNAALAPALSETETPSSPGAVARDASTCSAWGVADAVRSTSVGATAPWPPSGEPRPAGPAARAVVAHNAAIAAS